MSDLSLDKEICNKHWKNSLEFWSFGSNFIVSRKITLLREFCIFLSVVWAARQIFFVRTYFLDLDFGDRSRPTVKLGKFFYMSYGVSKLDRSLIFGQNFDYFSIFLRYSALFDQVPLLICKIWTPTLNTLDLIICWPNRS